MRTKTKCERIPNDAMPITHIHNYKFQILTKFAFKLLTPREPNDFTKHIQILPQWKQLLLKNYGEPANSDPLISLIQ